MEIKGKVYCFFEQSGTFKQEFIKLGIPAEDYDIQNHFGQTDNQCNLFYMIENAYNGNPSIFDNIRPDDLILAFFPCTYFCAPSQINFTWGSFNYRAMSIKQKTEEIIARNNQRAYFYEMAIEMFAVAGERGLRLIMENPWSENTYLKANFIFPPTIVDTNRMLRGDYRVKPTAYWFLNCTPTYGKSIQLDKQKKTHAMCKRSRMPGICSEERSMFSPDYARNFICDFILGKEQKNTIRTLF